MQRRREFYENHPEAKPSSLEQCGEASYQHLLTPEESICLTLNYHVCHSTPRYLRCPAAVSVGHLKKLIRAKYDLTSSHKVEVLYNQDCLSPSLTLMDVAYIYLWKRKEPIELTYRIYESTAKKPKLEPHAARTAQAATNNNNNWKEVQLRISENGEMSITGIQDGALSPSLLEIVNSDQKYKNELVTVVEAKAAAAAPKKELPGLKYIGKCPSVDAPANGDAKTTADSAYAPPLLTSCATLSSATTTTVFSTINSSKCSTKSDDAPVKPEPVKAERDDAPEKEKPPWTVNNVAADKCLKRKNDGAVEAEPPAKQPKPTILNHSIGLLNLSNNHPLKKHSKLNRNGESVVKNSLPEPEAAMSVVKLVTTGASDAVFSKPSFVNRNLTNVHLSRPGTPIMTSKLTPSSFVPPAAKPPCYMPKTSYAPVINVPKPTTSAAKPPNAPKTEFCPAKTTDAKPASLPVAQPPQQLVNLNNKIGIKSKPSTPIGYKTLRDPPKSWNSQISKANLSKPAADPKYCDQKNVRPAKFFKMRNNMPRYLGNPASGVKPMYQVHVSPEKEKHQEKSEIRKHSIVKIDPKTLKPISEKAPETTSLSNHAVCNSGPPNHAAQVYSNPGLGDLKINTSSVSIFNPLKLQSSPKNERKSPKSPHSPKPKAQASCSPTGGKRDKVNLNYTPPNPFIPNLASPTMSPNHFLYPAGPPGFPSYDPRMMAAYHSLWYSGQMGFPASPIPGLSLDLNQRKSFEMMLSPTSPKMAMPSQQVSTKLASTTAANASSMARSLAAAPKPPTIARKSPKEAKGEKSLQTTVEKLTQNRNKEISGKTEAAAAVRVDADKAEKRLESGDSGKNKEKGAETTLERVTVDVGSAPSPAKDEAKVAETVSESAKASADLKESPCADVAKEETSGSNATKSKNSNNSNNDKSSEGGK